MLDRLTIERCAAAEGPLLLALSGGGDSTALLHLLVEAFGAARVRALVVDHAVRSGSAGDARRALGFAEALGVAGEVITLSWPEGPARAQARWRRARYAALCAAARGLGAGAILTAHTADDQAETVLMRAAAGSSWRGLAGMALLSAAPLWPEGRGVLVGRPLLGVRRGPLRDFLRARGAGWIEDPANASPVFERVRTRATLAALETGGFDPMRLAGLAVRLRKHAERLDREALALIERAVRFDGDLIRVASARWEGGEEARRRAFSVLIAAAAGAEQEPAAPALARLEARFAASGFRGAALGGARLSRRGGEIVIGRDPGALFGRAGGIRPMAALPLTPGQETVWDGRLALIAEASGWAVVAAPGGPKLRHGVDGRLCELGQASVVNWLLEARVRHSLAPGP